MLQAITQTIADLDQRVKGHEDMKRQIEECLSYQRSIAEEKQLRMHIEEVRHPQLTHQADLQKHFFLSTLSETKQDSAAISGYCIDRTTQIAGWIQCSCHF